MMIFTVRFLRHIKNQGYILNLTTYQLYSPITLNCQGRQEVAFGETVKVG